MKEKCHKHGTGAGLSTYFISSTNSHSITSSAIAHG
jgi:hypothetical protein